MIFHPSTAIAGKTIFYCDSTFHCVQETEVPLTNDTFIRYTQTTTTEPSVSHLLQWSRLTTER